MHAPQSRLGHRGTGRCSGGSRRILPMALAACSFLAVPLGTVAPSPAEESTATEPRQLSVAPLDEVSYPEDRPAWIDDQPTIGETVDVWPVKSLLRPTAEEARESLRVQVRGAASAYAEQFLGAERTAAMPDSAEIVPEIETLPENDRYAGTAAVGEQTVYEEAVRLRFDESYRQRVAAAWQRAEVARRLVWLGAAGGGGMCLLLSANGLVRRIARRRVEPLR